MFVDLARKHGLQVRVLEIDERGWDFQVGHAVDADGVRWVLRVPRRPDVSELIAGEQRLLEFLRPRLDVALPRWEVCTSEFVAYRRLPGSPLAPEDPVTLAYEWWIDVPEELFGILGAVIAELHRAPAAEIAELGVPVSSRTAVRDEADDHLRRAESELDVPESRARRWREWIDDDRYWIGESAGLRLVHADLHPGHLLVDDSGMLTGILDWTDAAVDDPALDFVAPRRAFGESGLDRLLAAYVDAGGRPREHFREHVEQLSSFLFSVSLGIHGIDTGHDGYVKIAQERLRE
ncbi:macrolide 2'-phosphotransferase [Saccharopolyspora shandongensis]|uniref:macrolide 2'-phosphotransferase n=1 Tax=Saccharopolyspora shandongensis TaxID=418495 RepID=UPI0034459AF7